MLHGQARNRQVVVDVGVVPYRTPTERSITANIDTEQRRLHTTEQIIRKLAEGNKPEFILARTAGSSFSDDYGRFAAGNGPRYDVLTTGALRCGGSKIQAWYGSSSADERH